MADGVADAAEGAVVGATGRPSPLLKLQVEILRSRLPGNRVIPDPVERRRLLKAGAEVNHAIQDTLGIVSIKTYRRWLREQRGGRKPGKVGRPRVIPESLRELIVRLAGENAGWGVRRIVGELKKLAVRASRSSVRRVLVDQDILPDPDRHSPKGVPTPWRKFIAIHMNVMVACDFFCKTIWTPLGKKTAYVLAFIHLASRKVLTSTSTYSPTDEWMQQQARNARMWAEDEGIDVRFLLHDRDSKFTDGFDEHFRRADGGLVRTPPGAPIANCFIESWIGSLKRECLNQFFCFALPHLDHIVQTYGMYHNQHRPHQGLRNEPPANGMPGDGDSRPAPDNGIGVGDLRCQRWLGGLLKDYYRSAA